VRVRGIRWLGVRTPRIVEMREFAGEVLGMRLDRATEDFAELRTADGSRFELFGSDEAAGGPETFAANPVVAGFLVDDIEAARAELAATPGVEVLGEIQSLDSGYAWQHFRAPDGHVYELTYDPAA
jgi:catechol 2,3-dioxygenase-like lactoylglutathione lyase family enzyme